MMTGITAGQQTMGLMRARLAQTTLAKRQKSQPAKGMMAGMTLTPLNAAAIVDSLSASAAGMFVLEIHDSVGSTNDVVREFL